VARELKLTLEFLMGCNDRDFRSYVRARGDQALRRGLRLGLKVLRTAWINTDALWAGAFVLAGVLTLFT